MHNEIFVKEREKAGVVRPKAEGRRKSAYRVTVLNRPNASFLLGLIEVMDREQEGNPSVDRGYKEYKGLYRL